MHVTDIDDKTKSSTANPLYNKHVNSIKSHLNKLMNMHIAILLNFNDLITTITNIPLGIPVPKIPNHLHRPDE